jgi:hypothetical protein
MGGGDVKVSADEGNHLGVTERATIGPREGGQSAELLSESLPQIVGVETARFCPSKRFKRKADVQRSEGPANARGELGPCGEKVVL